MTIGEVIDRLERRHGGRPYSILVNGRRLSDISDLREIPPEALKGIDILDRSRASAFGFPPQDQILNLDLKPRFDAASTDVSVRQPTEGAATSGSFGLRYANINQERRFSASITLQDATALVAADRRQLLNTGELDPLSPYRTLMPSSRSFALTSGVAVPVGAVSTNLSANLSNSTSRQISRFFIAHGSGPGADPTGRTQVLGIADESLTRSYQLSATASGSVGKLNWTAEMTGGARRKSFRQQDFQA